MAQRDLIHRVLAVRSSDQILHHIAPLGLAAAAGRCLVVDLDESAPRYSNHTLRDLVDNGLRAADLEGGQGVAVLGNGGITFSDAASTVDRLLEGWGRMVVRDGGAPHPFRVLSVEPLLPEPFSPDRADIVQAIERGRTPTDRPMLPPLRRRQIRSILDGTIEPTWRWVRAWRAAWSRSWE
jgi:hypothetical protein